MPEGDTIFRAAHTLHRALAGQRVTRFESVLPAVSRIDHDAPLAGRTIEAVHAAGKHLLIRFSGDLVLRTHMRMNGSWHLYRPGERWQRPRSAMRVVLETADWVAVGFDVPVAEFLGERDLPQHRDLGALGPDLLGEPFDAAEAAARIAARGDQAIESVLLDQRAVAGIGNVYKSEVLFISGIHPLTPAARLSPADLARILAHARSWMRSNVQPGSGAGIVTYRGLRRTTGRSDPAARLWVYGRGGKPCRRCGTPIQRRKTGPHARSTYWCPRCQPPVESARGED